MAKTTPALLSTSSANDVKRSGGILSITGLDAIRLSDVASIRQIPYTAEVVQVYTLGTSAPTVVAGTPYSISIGNPFTKMIGQQDTTHKFTYVAPAILSGTAATDRETMYLALVAKINLLTPTLRVVAASLGSGTGITITDSTGYYAANPSTRGGASFVAVTAGFTAAMLVLTTPAVYAFGVGANLLANVPVIDNMTGNLISGSFNSPTTTPVTGQKYDGWLITYKEFAGHNAVHGGTVAFNQNQLVYVDNGAGTSVANLAGYLSFTKEMQRVQAWMYQDDPASLITFFDSKPTFTAPVGYGNPTGTAGDINLARDMQAEVNYAIIGTATILVPTWDATNGWLLDMDLTDTEGLEIVSSMDARNPQRFVVGQQEFSLKVSVTMTTVAKSFFTMGFRKREALNTTVTSYTELAAIGNTVASTALWRTAGNIAAGTTISTATTAAVTTLLDYELYVYVDIAGLVSCYVNGVKWPVYSVGTTPLILTAGTNMIPFVRSVNNGGTSGGAVIIKKIMSVPGKL